MRRILQLTNDTLALAAAGLVRLIAGDEAARRTYQRLRSNR